MPLISTAALTVAAQSAPQIAAQSASEEAGLTGIAGWSVDVMDAIGAPGAGLLVAAENLFPPLPSEIILPLAGFTATQGGFTLWEAIFWTTLGSVVGAMALYGLGAWLGRRRLYLIVDRIPLVDVHDVERTEDWFDKYGPYTIFLGRMVPLFRSLISIPAGVERMPFWFFTGLTALGSLIWNTIFVVAGWILGANWHLMEQWAGVFSNIVYVVVILFLIGWVVNRIVKMRRGKTDFARDESVEDILARRALKDEQMRERREEKKAARRAKRA